MGTKDVVEDLSRPFTSKPFMEKFTKPFERKPDTARMPFYENKTFNNRKRSTMDVGFHKSPNQLFSEFRKGT